MSLSIDLMLLGVFTLFYIAVVFIVGFIIILRYFQVRNKTFLYTGIGFIGIAFPWSGVALNFISSVFFSVVPPMELHFFLHGGFSAIFLFFWLMAILNLTGISSQKREKYLTIIGIIAFVVEIMYLSLIFYDTAILGVLINDIQVDYAPFSEIYLIFEMIIILMSGFWLAKKSLKSDDKKIRLKGKLLFSGFLLFPLATALEVLVPFIPIIILARILVIITMLLIYGGLILPKWMERLFLKKKNY
ncbi:hypothetical protein LCGC14_0492020 [marine sediment metagenome]|uniref:Histidine kinase N-terminal 7TM region domain-containing protein n=1 Tax=marine sediment metagenome TaxID=412755 RepID=A0A0F9SPR8_9ZZZZ|nr:MAG: hypothetical protein Lokiarch_07200 [Candidatus Lokiarchaeum sp. GC14_75]HEA71201.1 hypothetical protein [archaeon]